MLCNCTWKHFVVMLLQLLLITSVLVNHKTNVLDQAHPEVAFECLEPTGDSLLVCYFTKPVPIDDCCAKITSVRMIKGNLSRSEVTAWPNLEVHSYNMPVHMIANLGEFFAAIEQLTIHNSVLKHLHREAFSLIAPQLAYLDLSYNEIEDIPADTFDDLGQLVYLQLSGNKLKRLGSPSFLGRLHMLHTFAANSNKIAEISADFFDSEQHFANLRWIYMARNSLVGISVDFDRFRRLRAVDLRGNSKTCNFLFNSHEKRAHRSFVAVSSRHGINDLCR